MRYLFLLLLLAGCGGSSSESSDEYVAEKKRIHDWTKNAWIHSAMCERCARYKVNGYKDKQQKDMCKKYPEEVTTGGYEEWFDKNWKVAVDEYLTKREK